MTKVLLAIAWVSSIVVLGAPACADADLVAPPVATTQGIGCYWYRGHLHCSRYCYTEIDGQRYCHRRLRDAISQAPPPVIIHVDPLDPPYPAAGRLPRAGRDHRYDRYPYLPVK